MKLTEHPFIKSVVEARRQSIIDEVELLQLQDTDVIFEEESEPDALYLVLEGTITFTKERRDGSLQDVSQSGQGSFFGEVGVFTGERRALSARALGSAVVGRVPEHTIKKIIEDVEPVRRILESVIHHLKSTTDHYMDEVMRTEKLTLVGTMVSSLLHDFKNPFSVISLGSSLIAQKHPDDPKTVKICDNMQSQIRRMVNMANDLAAFSRGDRQINISHINMDELFDHFEELHTPFFKDKTVKLEMSGNGSCIEGDASKLLRVLQNLINNGIEAIHTIGTEGLVKVVASSVGDIVVLSVQDNGPGIPEGIRDNFFEPFVTHGKKEGTGLGTAIVKSIVEAHNGTIDFETSSQGTCFTIVLRKSLPVD